MVFLCARTANGLVGRKTLDASRRVRLKLIARQVDSFKSSTRRTTISDYDGVPGEQLIRRRKPGFFLHARVATVGKSSFIYDLPKTYS